MSLLTNFKIMLGWAVERTTTYTPEAEAMHEAKRQIKGTEKARQIREAHAGSHSKNFLDDQFW